MDSDGAGPTPGGATPAGGGTPPDRGTRGRVVMLVDNDVKGDSRVQKAARSAADLGWDVTLLGRSPHGETETWRVGEAEVRLVPMPDPLHKRRHEFRRAWLRWPLAYPPNGIAAHHAAWARACQADLTVRQAELDLAAASGRPAPALRRRLLRARRLAADARRRWVSLRYWMLTRARKGRRLRSPWDRAYTLFWQWVQGDRAWRHLEPGLWDFELAYGPVIDGLAPDLIHAHDFRMIGVGARAAVRGRAQGRPVKLVWDAHEYLPGVTPWYDNTRWQPAHLGYEREYVPYADAVITVSDELAGMLQEQHHLGDRPSVMLNAPALGHAPAGDDPVPDLRAICGVGPDDALLVYSGTAPQQRGVDIMVEALPLLERTHVALIVNRPRIPYIQAVLTRAAELRVADRVHLVPYVPYWQVSRFLSAADVGVIPIRRWLNYEIALIQKFFEYSHARLPIVVSDLRTMAETVRATGQGEVFRSGDVDDFVRATRAVLDDPRRYRAAYDKPGLLDGWTWEAQVPVLDALYNRLLPDRARDLAPAHRGQ